jgi:uncharacterized RDD family membrane protein YckC
MSDPTQNPRPEEGSNPSPYGDQGATPPPPPPSGGQGSYGTQPPPQGGYQQPPPGGWQQPGAMPPPPPAQTGGIGQPADLLPRFVARLLDFILLGFVNAILVSFLVVSVIMGTNAGNVGGLTFDSGTSWAAGAISSLVSAAIALGYFSLMEAKLGKTLGKMVMRLETRGPDGGHPTMEQAVKRNAWTAIGVLGVIPVLGVLSGFLSLAAIITIAVTIYNNKANRHGWHDDFAGGTTVFRIG